MSVIFFCKVIPKNLFLMLSGFYLRTSPKKNLFSTFSLVVCMASKLYGVNVAMVIFIIVLYCFVFNSVPHTREY